MTLMKQIIYIRWDQVPPNLDDKHLKWIGYEVSEDGSIFSILEETTKE